MKRAGTPAHLSVMVALLLAAVIAGVSFGTTAIYQGPVPPLTPALPVNTSWFAPTADVDELVVNGSFETGDFTGWVLVNAGPAGKGSWFATDASVGPLSGIALQPPSDGTFQAVVDQSDQGMRILYQDITIPQNASGDIKIVFWLENYLRSYADPGTLDHNVIPNQQARIDIMDPAAPVDDVGAGVLLNLFKTNPGDTTSVPPTLIQQPIDALAGLSIRLRFVEVDNQFFFNIGVDAVSMAVTVPTPVEEVSWGVIKSIYLR